MYAVIEDSGTQIKVSEGDVIKVAIRDIPEDAASLTFDKVMLVGDESGESTAKIGAPLLDGASVTADILEQGRTEKVNVVKMKRRKNYRRKNGHRQDYLKVRVTAIHA